MRNTEGSSLERNILIQAEKESSHSLVHCGCRKMSTTNLTEYKDCSAELASGIEYQMLRLSVLNIISSITAFLGNALILVALYKEASLHSPFKLLLRSLALTDPFVAIFVERIHVTQWISVAMEHLSRHICCVSVTSRKLCSASLLILTAISLNRLLALLLGLRYRQVVTLNRTYVTVRAFWFVSIVVSLISFWYSAIWAWYIRFVIQFVPSYVGVLLHGDFPQAASSSNSSSRQCYKTTEPTNSTEHSAIQKDSDQCTVAAVDIRCLLFTIYCSAVSGSFRHSRQAFFSLSSYRPIYNKFNLFQLIIKSECTEKSSKIAKLRPQFKT